MGLLAEFAASQQGAAPAAPAPSMTPYTPEIVPDDRTGTGLAGFVGNFFADVKDIGLGLARIGGYAIGDVADYAKEAVTLGGAETNIEVLRPGFVVDMVKGIGDDLQDRYLDGDIAHEVYDHPLSFIADAFVVAGGAGAAARAAAGQGWVGKVALGTGLTDAARVGKIASAVNEIRTLRRAQPLIDAAIPAAAVAEGTVEAGTAAGRLARIKGVFDGTPTGQALAAADNLNWTPVNPAITKGMATITDPVSGVTGIETIGQLMKRVQALPASMRRIEKLLPNPVRVADPVSGHTVMIRGSRNPLMRALWSNPIQRRALTYNLSYFEAKLAQVQKLKNAGLPHDPAELSSLTVAVNRMRSQGAELVATPIYARNVILRKRVDKLVGGFNMRGIVDKQRAKVELGRFLELVEEPDEFWQMIEGLKNGTLNRVPDEVLDGKLVQLGYAGDGGLEEAARDALYRTDGGRMDEDVRATIIEKVVDGHIQLAETFRYDAPADLVDLPERQRFESEMRAASEQAHIPTGHQDFYMNLADSSARVLSQALPERYPTPDAVYASMRMQYLDSIEAGEGFAQRVEAVARQYGGAVRYRNGEPVLNVKRLADEVLAGLSDDPDSREWWARGTQVIADITAGRKTKFRRTMPDGSVVEETVDDFEVLADLLAVTSIGRNPKEGFAAALRIYEEFKKGKVDGLFTPDGHMVDPATGKRLTRSKGSQGVTKLVREIVDGHGIQRWEAEISKTGDLPLAEVIARFRDGKRRLGLNDRQKVRAMAAALKGQADISVNDRRIALMFGIFTGPQQWAKAFGGNESLWPKGSFFSRLDGAEYRRVTDWITEVRDQVNVMLPEGTRPLTIAETQAVLWGRAERFMAAELSLWKRKMRKLAVGSPERARAEDYMKLVEAAITGRTDNADFLKVWDEMKDTAAGQQFLRNVQRRMGTTTRQLAQKMSAEIKGQVVFGDDFQAVVTLASTGDFTTLVHEHAHMLRRMLPEAEVEALRLHYAGKVEPPAGVTEVVGPDGPIGRLYQAPNRSLKGRQRWASVTTADGEMYEGQFVVVKGSGQFARQQIESMGEVMHGLEPAADTKVGRILYITADGDPDAIEAQVGNVNAAGMRVKRANEALAAYDGSDGDRIDSMQQDLKKQEKALLAAQRKLMKMQEGEGQFTATVDMRNGKTSKIPVSELRAVPGTRPEDVGLADPIGIDWDSTGDNVPTTSRQAAEASTFTGLAAPRFETFNAPGGSTLAAGSKVVWEGKELEIIDFALSPRFSGAGGRQLFDQQVVVRLGQRYSSGSKPVVTERVPVEKVLGDAGATGDATFKNNVEAVKAGTAEVTRAGEVVPKRPVGGPAKADDGYLARAETELPAPPESRGGETLTENSPIIQRAVGRGYLLLNDDGSLGIDTPVGTRVTWTGWKSGDTEWGEVIEVDPNEVKLTNDIEAEKVAWFRENEIEDMPVVDMELRALDGNHRVFTHRTGDMQTIKAIQLRGRLEDELGELGAAAPEPDEASLGNVKALKAKLDALGQPREGTKKAAERDAAFKEWIASRTPEAYAAIVAHGHDHPTENVDAHIQDYYMSDRDHLTADHGVPADELAAVVGHRDVHSQLHGREDWFDHDFNAGRDDELDADVYMDRMDRDAPEDAVESKVWKAEVVEDLTPEAAIKKFKGNGGDPKLAHLIGTAVGDGWDYDVAEQALNRAILNMTEPAARKRGAFAKLGKVQQMERYMAEIDLINEERGDARYGGVPDDEFGAGQEDFARAQGAIEDGGLDPEAVAALEAPEALPGAAEPPAGSPPDAGAPEPPEPPDEPPGEWTREMEEAFAEDFERWVFNKIEPADVRVMPGFRALRDALTNLWSSVRGFAREQQLVPGEAAAVFDRYFGGAFDELDNPKVTRPGKRRTRAVNIAPIEGPSLDMVPPAAATGPEIEQLARTGQQSLRRKLGAIFGRKGFTTRVKSLGDIERKLKSGLSTSDALGGRVIVDTWADADAVPARLAEQGLEVVGVLDHRGTAGDFGKRGVWLAVRDADTGAIAEIEVGTPLFDRFRDSTFVHEKRGMELVASQQRLQDEIGAAGAELIGHGQAGPHPNQAGLEKNLADLERQLEAVTIELGAARRYMEGFYEMLVDEIDGSFIGGNNRAVINELRLWNARHIEADLFARGYWDFRYAFERLFLPIRKERGGFFNKEKNDWEGGGDPYEIDNARSAEGLPMPVYFAHIEKAPPMSDFVMQRGRTLLGARKMADNPNLRRNKGILDDYNTDVREVYMHRMARAVKMRDTFEMVDKITRTYARLVERDANGNPMIGPGEVLMAPDFTRAFFKVAIGLEDRMADLLAKMPLDDLMVDPQDFTRKSGFLATGEIVEAGLKRTFNVEEVMPHALMRALEDTMPATIKELVAITSKGVDLYALPKAVADRINASLLPQFSKNVRLWWDTPTEMWRSVTLYGRPAWVANNVAGNISFLKIQGGRFMDVIRQMYDPEFRDMAQQMADMVPGADVGFIGSQVEQYAAHLGSMSTEAGAEVVDAMRQAAQGVRAFQPFRKFAHYMKFANTSVENYFRRASLIRAGEQLADEVDGVALRSFAHRIWTDKKDMERLLIDGIDPKRADAMLDRVNTFFGDFSSLGPTERKLVRRFLFPFYGFYKHVVTLFAKLPSEYPGRFAVIRALTETTERMREEYGPLPEWMDGMVPFGPLQKDGSTQWMSTGGPNPFNVLTDSGLSMLHPMFKILLEQSTGRDSFTGRPFTDPDVVRPFGSDIPYRIIRGEDGRPIDAVPVEKVTPGPLVHLLSQIPQYDLIKNTLAGGRAYDTQGILGSLLGGPVTDSAGETVRPTGLGESVSRYMGLSTFPFDVGGYQDTAADVRRQALNTALKQWAASNA